MKTCAFTGHRPQSLPFGFDETDMRCVRLKQILKNQIIRIIREEGVTYFITGMARGIDQFAAEIVLKLKQSYPEIKLECAVPCRTQPVKWEKTARERYQSLLAKCDRKTVLQEKYTKDCMQKRNRYMVDHAEVLLAVWDGTPGGTGSTVRYATEQRKKVYKIDPLSLQVEILAAL